MHDNYVSTLLHEYCPLEDPLPYLGSDIKAGSISPYAITRGGFGDIWSALHVDGRQIAIKTLRPYGDLATFDRRTLEKRAIRELSVWRKINHPNVLKLLGVCDLGGEIGMVSEWMVHGNIMQYTTEHKDANKLKLITNATTGLAYLHERGIIHGDLKGGNIVIAADGTARLVDFGLAKMTESALKFSATSTVKGTHRWMAPELMNPDEKSKAFVTFATDIYSMGMTILEIYSGRHPFVELMNDAQVIMAHRN
ncbi:unnamed protein product [Rhizoctonia solani]|uniref:Protein kinase domain-containing protein n=1 Tax=Rhizoctonia solani TaxID=456999 RepID=A0A8H2WM41_9AGAM|nr:unnamed protein product [Rhizoctonia solani]